MLRASSSTEIKNTGKVASVPIIEGYRPGRIVYLLAKIDPRLDKRLVRAATIAQERSHAHSKSRCWHYVKDALLASGVVKSRPRTIRRRSGRGVSAHLRIQ